VLHLQGLLRRFGRPIGRGFLLGAAAVWSATTDSVAAQTNDVVFRSWHWEEQLGAARPTGMGDAFVAISDDASASIVNPAGLVRCGKFAEGTFSAVVSHEAPFGPDSLDGRSHGWPVVPVSANMRLGCRWAVGAYWSRPRAAQIVLGGSALPNGTRYEGSMDEATLKGPGLALGFRVNHRLTLGANVNFMRLGMTASYSEFAASGAETLRINVDDNSPIRLTATFGALFDVTRRLKAGAVYRLNTSWPLSRNAADPRVATTPREVLTFEVRAPDIFTGALAWDVRVGHRRQWLTLAGQADRTRYSQVASELTIRRGSFRPTDYQLTDAWEPHLGLEWSIPTSCWSGCGSLLQLRAGAQRQGSGTLAYQGVDANEAATFPGSSARWVWSAGASVARRIVFPVRLDAAVRFGDHVPTTLVIDLGVRYGVTFGDVGPR